MIESLQDGSENSLTYNRPITAGEFELTDFLFSDGTQNPISIVQVNPTTLRLTVLTTVSGGTLSYSGNVPGVLTPDVITPEIL